MELLSVRKIARNPVIFLRLVVPFCLEVPRVRLGYKYTVFEVLTDAEYLVDTEVFTWDEMEEIHGTLETVGLRPFEPTVEVRELVRNIEWELRGMQLFAREYPFIERLKAARKVLEDEKATAARRVLREVNHLINCHVPVSFGNQPLRKSSYQPK